MRAKPGRPDLRDYARLFRRARRRTGLRADRDVGRRHHAADRRRRVGADDRRLLLPAQSGGGRVRRISPSLPRIDGCLARLGVDRLEAVLPVHTHYDHAMDSAVVAERTGARLVGGTSAVQVGRGHGLPEDRLVVATSGEPITLGAYDVTLVESEHCPPDRFPGVITEPVVPPVKASAYKCGEAWSTLVHHRPSDRRLLIVGSAGFVADALAGQRADVVYLGVGQLGLQPEQLPGRLLGRDRPRRRRPPRRADPLGRFLPPTAQAAAGAALRRSTIWTSRCGCSPGWPTTDGIPLHLPTLWQARRSVGLGPRRGHHRRRR